MMSWTPKDQVGKGGLSVHGEQEITPMLNNYIFTLIIPLKLSLPDPALAG